jgi:ABC-2 type transport system ATP-binding protein
VSDNLVLLIASRVRIAGDVEDLLASHHRLIGPRRDPASLPSGQHVVEATHTERQSTLLVQSDAPIHDPVWTIQPVDLADLVLAYMRQAADAERQRTGLSVVRT